MKIRNQKLLWVIILLSLNLSACDAQIKNAQKLTVMVYGNCGMCKKTIETAANKKGLVKAEWNENTKMLSLTFDSTKTNKDEILTRIANAGYDNEKFLAPDSVYARLHGCCQYDRVKKTAADSTLVK